MRRFCITLVLVPSLLVAASPVQAKSTSSHRHEARAGLSQTHVTKAQRVNRSVRTGKRVHKFTYGRT